MRLRSTSLFVPAETALAEAVLSVEDLTRQIKRVIESDPILIDIGVRGEISNCKAHRSGHLYFTLKDGAAQLRCCMWRGRTSGLRFRPTDGNRVVARGHVEFYCPRGEVSFIVDDLSFDGQGALYEAFERLKQQLAEEGLFDPDRKRPLPPMPRRIGLISSPTGAVVHDVVTILQRRWPLATVVFISAAVQGFAAAPDLMRALSWAAAQGDLDVVIVARGGGSAEDLWAFNDEELVRAAARFPRPLISAIGHETDFTLLDFVADLRAPTPSAAAELVAPDLREVQAALRSLRWRLHNAVAGEARFGRQRLDHLLARRVLTEPRQRLRDLREDVAALRTRVQDTLRQRVKIERQTLVAQRAQLRALDPQRVLERGYALVSRSATGQLVTSIRQVRKQEHVRITLADGNIVARVGSLLEATEDEQGANRIGATADGTAGGVAR